MNEEVISTPEDFQDYQTPEIEPSEQQSEESLSRSGTKQQRIANLTAVGLLSVAAIFDLINWIPIVNYFATVGETLVFGFWFWRLGLGWKNPRVVASAAVGLIVGAIPALSAVPETIASVGVIIAITKAEDTLGIKIPLSGITEGGGVSKPPPLPGA